MTRPAPPCKCHSSRMIWVLLSVLLGTLGGVVATTMEHGAASDGTDADDAYVERSHMARAHAALAKMAEYLPVKTTEDIGSLENVVSNDDPNFKEWSSALRAHHTAWVDKRVQERGNRQRRRAQQGAAADQRVAAEILAWDEEEVLERMRNPRTGWQGLPWLNDPNSGQGYDSEGSSYLRSGESVEDGLLRYEHLRSVFSSAVCTDPLATNFQDSSVAEACQYRCEELQEHYFPGLASRCFLYNLDAGRWEETATAGLRDRTHLPGGRPFPLFQGGLDSGDHLLELKQTSLDWHTFLEPDGVENLAVSFVMGNGRTCTNVTVRTANLLEAGMHETASVEEHCLLDGVHEVITGLDEAHSVHVVGYLENTTYGGTSTAVPTIVVGECTDVTIRLETTRAASDEGGSMTWTLAHDAHGAATNADDSWSFVFPGRVSSVGAPECAAGQLDCTWSKRRFYEIETCMFNNDFTLTHADSTWEGTISVLSTVDDNTVYIPNDENWIIHGLSQNDIPTSLDARLSTGYRQPISDDDESFPIPDHNRHLSHANVVLRNLRISGQVATLDKFSSSRTQSSKTVGADPASRLGGALYYEGTGSNITIDRTVFDHNFATSGACFMVDGRMELLPDDPVNIQISSSFFWKNWATWVGGMMRPNDIWPLQLSVADTVTADNQGFIGNVIGASLYPVLGEGDELDGTSMFVQERVHHENFGTRNYLGQNTYTMFSGIKATEGTGVTIIEDEVTQKGQRAFAASSWLIYDPNPDPSASLTDTMIVRNGLIKDHINDGEYFGAPLMFESDTFVAENMRFIDNWGTGRSSQGGALRIVANLGATVSHVHFEGNRGGMGAALFLIGSSPTEIRSSYFANNVAQVQGGAISWQVAGDIGLMIENSIFVHNVVQSDVRLGVQYQDVTFRVYSGNTGIDATGPKVEWAIAPVLPMWFIGPGKDSLLRTHLPRRTDGSLDEMRQALSAVTCSPGEACPDGTECPAVAEPVQCPPFTIRGSNGNITTMAERDRLESIGSPDEAAMYHVESTYATVLRLATGWHRIWHGSQIFTSDTWHTDWDNGGYIQAVDITGKIYPQLCDNRANPCVDVNELGKHYAPSPGLGGAYVREPGCYAGGDGVSVAEDPSVNMCPRGMFFWSYTDIEIPYGAGGAVFASSDGTVEIRNTEFHSNLAGAGSSLSVVNLRSVEITNATFQMAHSYMGQHFSDVEEAYVDEHVAAADFVGVTGATLETCESMPCPLSNKCEFSGGAVRNCLACQSNEVGDGQHCSACGPGTQPNADQTDCVSCETGKFSNIGACQDCPSGKIQTVDFTGCTPCAEGTHRTADGAVCAACVPGKSPDPQRASCISCTQPGLISAHGTGCSACPAGSAPNDNRTTCELCGEGLQSSDGTLCEPCTGGSQARNDGTGCDGCPPGTVSRQGEPCMPCDPGFQPVQARDQCQSCALVENTVSEDGNECRVCGARTQPRRDLTTCVCQSNTYNTFSIGRVRCNGLQRDKRNDLNDECAACPDCMDCSDAGAPSLRAGWAFYGQNEAYACPGDKEIAEDACQGGVVLSNLTVSSTTWSVVAEAGPGNTKFSSEALESQCAASYSGPICGSCRDGFHHLKVGKQCTACRDGRVDIPMLIGLVFGSIIVASIVLSGLYNMLVDHGIITDLRLLLGFYQLLGQMDNVLSISFPHPVPELLDLIGFLFLDLRKFIKLDCWDIGGFYGKLTTNIFVLPAMCLSFCGLLYINQRRTIKAVIAAGGSDESAYRTASVGLQQNIFLSIFLIYPMYTTTLFRVPQCQEIGADAFHEDDFEISCQSGTFYAAMAFAFVLILAVPIGVPLVFLLMMYRAKNRLPNGQPNTTLLGGAKLCADDLADEDDRYGFLCRDLKPEYWYYEIVCVHYLCTVVCVLL